jgi:2'-5' RNA ligase
VATRTFLAFDLDEAIRRQLVTVAEQLDSVGAKVRWTELEQLHVTMKFLGAVSDEDLPRVCDAAIEIASAVPAFDFSVARVVSAPPHGHMRMIWVGIDEPTGRMGELHRQLDLCYSGMGYRAEGRGFHAHLTLGRVKSGQRVAQLRQAIAGITDMEFGQQGADELIVYASELTSEGPVYAPLARAPLG